MRTFKPFRGTKGRGAGKRHNLFFGLLTAMGILAAAVTLAALLVSGEKMSLERCWLIGKLLYGAAVFAGCWTTARRSSQAKLLWSALTGILACALVLGAVYALPGENAVSVGSLLGLTAAAWLAGGFAGTRKRKNCYF